MFKTPASRNLLFSAITSSILAWTSAVSRADSITYQFKSGDTPVYEISVHTQGPQSIDTQNYYVMYEPVFIDPGTGNTKLKYYWSFGDSSKVTNGQTTSSKGFPPEFLATTQPAEDKAAGQFTVDSRGNVTDPLDFVNQFQLPNILGYIGQFVVQPLPPANQTTWNTHRPLVIFTNSTHQEAGGMWGHHDVTTRTDMNCQESIDYSLGARQGDLQIVNRSYNLISDEKADNQPVDQLTGNGDYAFNTKTGFVKSLEFKLTNEIRQTNFDLKVPIDVTARMLSSDEISQLRTKSAADAQRRTTETTNFHRDYERDVTQVPDNVEKTPMVGGQGGGPFMKMGPQGSPVIGFRIRIGHWDGHNVIGQIDPLYNKTNDIDTDPEDQGGVAIARDGYAVGGLWINATKNADAVRVIFMKKTDKGLDPKVAYVSPWYGELQGPSRIKMGATGKFVVGTFGRKGLNTDALGLLMAKADPTDDPNAASTPKDPTDDPNFKGTAAP